MAEKIIIGTGRHALETYYLLEDIGMGGDVMAFAIDKPEEGQEFAGKKVMSINDLLLHNYSKASKPSLIIAIGAVDINKRLAKLLSEAHFSFFSAISKNISVNRQNILGKGITIAWGCVLTCNISIGDHTIINVGCTISHDCIIGNHVNISPGSHLAGGVVIEDDVFVGTGATFIPKVRVGQGSIIAAGSVVVNDLPEYSMVAGVPAKVKKFLKNTNG